MNTAVKFEYFETCLNEFIVDPELKKFILASKQLSLEQLLENFEAFFIKDKNPNLNGAFYTPSYLAQKVVANALTKIDLKNNQLKFLDPACGAGIFVLHLFKQIHAQSTQIKSSQVKHSKDILEKIYAIDLDPLALSICRFSLALLALQHFGEVSFETIRTHIIESNTLLDDQIFSGLKFDCIVGNPPYGLSRNQQISALENKVLRQKYAQYLCGRVNKYLVFMAKGYELLNENGILSYIVPNAWLGIKEANKIREFLITHKALTEIQIMDFPAFEKIGVETIIFQIRKSIAANKIEVKKYASKENFINQHISFETNINYDQLSAHDSFSIPVSANTASIDLLNLIRSNSKNLSQFGFISKIALQAYALGRGKPAQNDEDVKNHIYHANKKLSKNYHPYLEGRHIQAYKICWNNDPKKEWLSYGPWLAEYPDFIDYSSPRIIIREIISKAPYKLIACYLDQTYFYNKSVLHILDDQRCQNNMINQDRFWALLAIFNSKLASFIIDLQGRKSKRKLFPKIVNDDLKNFPVTNNFNSYIVQLAELAKQLSTPTQNSSLNQLRSQVDQLVYRAYGLNHQEIAIIEANLS